MSACAVYARVSTVGKGQETENQLAQIRAWCAKEGHEIVAEYVDTVSGSGKRARPEFERMMRDAEAGRFQQLLFWSLDRLSREGVLTTLQHLKRLDDAGVCWRSHTEQYLDSCGMFRDAVLAILAVVAKQERVRISERVRAGLEIARSKGRVGGRPKAQRNAALVQMAAALHEKGQSLTQIAERLQSRGHQVSRSWVQRALQ